jgi:hypothetical protein
VYETVVPLTTFDRVEDDWVLTAPFEKTEGGILVAAAQKKGTNLERAVLIDPTYGLIPQTGEMVKVAIVGVRPMGPSPTIVLFIVVR